MMEIELPKMHQSQQDMDLIDILWRQDIDLGAGREVFDYSHRQKEHELQRQRELEEEKRQQLLREQEKALLAQLQLDEETGEFVPRPAVSADPLTSATPPEVTQVGLFTEEEGNALSFDECMQLLAETFPLVDAIEATAPSTDPSISPPAMMAPHQPALPPAAPKTSQDMEQAWMELLSIPELQCLNMQMTDVLEPTFNAASAPTEMQDPNYNFYMPALTDMVTTTADPVCPSGYLGTFEGTLSNAIPPDNLNQMTLKPLDLNASFNADGFCDMFYPGLVNTKVDGNALPASSGSTDLPLTELQNAPPLNTMDIPKFALGEGFESRKPEVMGEFPDSDSGLSLDASPNASSPEKSVSGDGSFGYSDSEMEEMDSNPGSVDAESDFAEMFSPSFLGDGHQAPSSVGAPCQESKVKHPKTEPAECGGHAKPPFTKDKHKKRSETRLSRDEQRAKALQIPFTVDMIINLPVDDFNEMMSKQQLNEAQLALVRDIRRRGKNKVAAQNCRKRKMENIVGLEYELDSLKEERERLLKERTETGSSLREMKQQLNSLYLEVFGLLRDEDGKPYSPSEYSLQQTSDGSVFLVPRVKKTLIKSDGN
ncbi:nuclear factor erythroid 2-related factor 2a isoform X2 [Conger conger]|uniref:nuclear factor erythroid 2-related factor 2a isoform X2 n=1 Tax=Conger conger TaxID=82655 RepID=UPI002A5A5781|nr:nuclear factor erythroid 2-related factor 2a isoform X2 [Conger conger]